MPPPTPSEGGALEATEGVPRGCRPGTVLSNFETLLLLTLCTLLLLLLLLNLAPMKLFSLLLLLLWDTTKR